MNNQKIEKELIDITQYQVKKVRVVPFLSSTYSKIAIITASAVILGFTVICLIIFFS
ncbi:MAG: hypothetical protein ACRC42_00195 [Mycoplasma sp.]